MLSLQGSICQHAPQARVRLCVSSSFTRVAGITLCASLSHCSGLLRIILLTEMEYLPVVEVLSKRESLCNPLNEFGIQCEAEMAARKSDVHMMQFVSVEIERLRSFCIFVLRLPRCRFFNLFLGAGGDFSRKLPGIEPCASVGFEDP